jgi:DNA invertase Pin-like site-specific DNA recombinase
MKYFGYARKSTIGQNETSIEAQLEYLRLQAESLGMVFEARSESKSGKSLEGREELIKVMADAESGDIIGVYDNSRLGRDTADNLAIIKSLYLKGVRVQISSKILDPNNPEDELFFTIQSSVSTYNRKSQLLKSKAGINLKKRNGDWVMRGDLYGYRVVKQGGKTTISIEETEAEIVRLVYKHYAEGLSTNKITKLLNEQYSNRGGDFYTGSIRRLLRKPIYMGYYYKDQGSLSTTQRYTKQQVEQNLVLSKLYPQIVNEESWWEVFNSYRYLPRTHARQYQHRWTAYELSSIVHCAYCGKGYVHYIRKDRRKDNDKPFYSCYTHRKGCGQHIYTVPLEILEPLMRSTMYMTFADFVEMSSFFQEKRDALTMSIEQVKKAKAGFLVDVKELEKRKAKLIVAIEQDILPLADVKERLDIIDREKKKLEERLQSLDIALTDDEVEFYDLMQQTQSDELDKFYVSDEQFRRSKYIALIEYCKLYADKLVVRYKNTKTFVMLLKPRFGSRKKAPIEVRVGYKGKFQYKCLIDPATEEIQHVPVDYGNKFANVVNEVFAQQLKEMQDHLKAIQ